MDANPEAAVEAFYAKFGVDPAAARRKYPDAFAAMREKFAAAARIGADLDAMDVARATDGQVQVQVRFARVTNKQ